MKGEMRRYDRVGKCAETVGKGVFNNGGEGLMPRKPDQVFEKELQLKKTQRWEKGERGKGGRKKGVGKGKKRDDERRSWHGGVKPSL